MITVEELKRIAIEAELKRLNEDSAKTINDKLSELRALNEKTSEVMQFLLTKFDETATRAAEAGKTEIKFDVSLVNRDTLLSQNLTTKLRIFKNMGYRVVVFCDNPDKSKHITISWGPEAWQRY